MSITQETLQKHLKDPAIFCCRREKGLVISAADLEDPGLFDDMVEAGLLTLSPDGLRIEQVIGCTLLEDVEALTPITKDVLDKVNAVGEEEKAEPEVQVEKAEATPVIQSSVGGDGMIHIEIGKAEKFEGLKLDVPVLAGAAPAAVPTAAPADEKTGEKTVIRSLVKKHIKITDVKLGNKTSIENGVITIDKKIVDLAVKEDGLCKSLALDVIYPDKRHIYTETIMDVCPIATKVEGELGEGITKVADGVVFMLTGVDEDGVQVHEFGSSEGYLDEKMYYGHPGCADENDIIIRCHAVIERLSGMTRPGPFAAHKCQDYIIQAIRDELKGYEGEVVREEVCEDVRRVGNPRVVLVKEIMGPFNTSGDFSYRTIEFNTPSDQLMVTHGGFDNSDINKDVNAMFPIDRLHELVAEGFIGSLSDETYTFMGGGNVEKFTNETGPEIARKLKAQGVDIVLCTGGCGTCHRSATIVTRCCESEGMSCVVIAALPPIARQQGAPRITAPHVPIGSNAGEPNNIPQQTAIIKESLEWVRDCPSFNQTKVLPYEYRHNV